MVMESMFREPPHLEACQTCEFLWDPFEIVWRHMTLPWSPQVGPSSLKSLMVDPVELSQRGLTVPTVPTESVAM